MTPSLQGHHLSDHRPGGGEDATWTSRPLERIYAAVVLDAINVKVRDGQVANRPVYAAIGVDLEGQKDILGMWFGDGGGESAKFWMAALRSLYHDGMVRIGVTPSWAKLIDFETTLPSAVEELLRQREERQHG